VNLLGGAFAMGLILALLSVGTFISFRVLRSLDLTTDGSFTTGAAVAGALLVAGAPPPTACLGALLAGAVCGGLTGVIHTRFRIDVILAGILVTTALYSVDIWAMGSGNLSIAGHANLFDDLAALGEPAGLSRDAAAVVLLGAGMAALGLALGSFAGTDLGLALRATGSSPRMAKATGIDTDLATTIGLAMANGCIGLSGALFAQHEGFANVQMGQGMVVTGLASLILGEALFPQRTIKRRIAAAILGAVAFRLLVASALRAGMNPNALKLVTAVFVLAALTLPRLLRRQLSQLREASHG
jgi:putative tryptophan/tyrosine transport system permease protein